MQYRYAGILLIGLLLLLGGMGPVCASVAGPVHATACMGQKKVMQAAADIPCRHCAVAAKAQFLSPPAMVQKPYPASLHSGLPPRLVLIPDSPFLIAAAARALSPPAVRRPTPVSEKIRLLN